MCRNHVTSILGIAAMVQLLAISVWAQTTFVDEDFESPVYPNSTVVPAFTGWTWTGPYSTGDVKLQTSAGTSDVPADDHPTTTNQVIKLDQVSPRCIANYATGLGWQSGKAFTLTLNASPMSWAGTSDRYIEAKLIETVGETELCSFAAKLLPHYNSFGRSPWTEDLTFAWVALTDDFSGGTPGSNVTLRIVHTGARGLFFDNVSLVMDEPVADNDAPTPDPMGWVVEPSSTDYGYVTMTCSNASDIAGVEYLFTNIVRQTGSGWQDETEWNEGGLDPATLYTYKAMARDKSTNENETGWSPEKSATTPAVEEGTLVITGFQCPAFNLSALVNNSFEGWVAFSSPKSSRDNTNGFPDDTDVTGRNQGVQFENLDDYIQYDIDHDWDASDVYTLTLNSVGQYWPYPGSTVQRYVRPSLREQDGTVLWAPGENLAGDDKTALPLNDTNYESSDWQSEPTLNFTFTIEAADFVGVSGASEGEPLSLRIASSGSRGMFVDNVTLSRVIPPAGSTFLFR